MPSLLDFSDRLVVITGAASGMGRETLRLLLERGADVHVLDNAPVDTTDLASNGRVTVHACDLGRAGSIDEVVAALPNSVDALLNCAGIPNGGRFAPLDVMRVNWLGLRHLTEAILPRMGSQAAVVHIASTAGRAWPERLDAHQALMAAESFADGEAWIEANPDVVGDGYPFSKEAVQFYTHWRAVQLLPTGVRMNSVCPGITDTGIISDFRKGMGDDIIDTAEALAGRMAEPSEMAPAMLFLADYVSSSYINGVNLNIDRGTGAARLSHQTDPTAIWGTRS